MQVATGVQEPVAMFLPWERGCPLLLESLSSRPFQKAEEEQGDADERRPVAKDVANGIPKQSRRMASTRVAMLRGSVGGKDMPGYRKGGKSPITAC